MEKRKLLTELTTEELKELYKINGFLQEKTQEEAAETVNFWLSDFLEYFRECRKLDYNIGYPGNYFTFKTAWAGLADYRAFFDALQEVNNTFCTFTEATAAKINRAGKNIDFLLDAIFGYEDISEKNAERITAYIENLFKAASDEILQFLVADYDAQFNDEFLIDEILPLYAENFGSDYTTDGTRIFELEVRSYT